MVVCVSPFARSSSFCFFCLGILWAKWGVTALTSAGLEPKTVHPNPRLVSALPMPGRAEAMA